jgi:hypothetical protein
MILEKMVQVAEGWEEWYVREEQVGAKCYS